MSNQSQEWDLNSLLQSQLKITNILAITGSKSSSTVAPNFLTKIYSKISYPSSIALRFLKFRLLKDYYLENWIPFIQILKQLFEINLNELQQKQ